MSSDEATRDLELARIAHEATKNDEAYPVEWDRLDEPGRAWCVKAARAVAEAVRAERAAGMVEIDRQLLEDAVECVYDAIADNEQYPLRADLVAQDQAIAARIEAILQRD